MRVNSWRFIHHQQVFILKNHRRQHTEIELTKQPIVDVSPSAMGQLHRAERGHSCPQQHPDAIIAPPQIYCPSRTYRVAADRNVRPPLEVRFAVALSRDLARLWNLWQRKASTNYRAICALFSLRAARPCNGTTSIMQSTCSTRSWPGNRDCTNAERRCAPRN